MSGIEKEKKLVRIAKDIIVMRALARFKEPVQEDLGEVKFEDVDHVLARFARAVVEIYEDYIKNALFPHEDKAVRDILFRNLILERVAEFLRMEIEEDDEEGEEARKPDKVARESEEGEEAELKGIQTIAPKTSMDPMFS